MAERRSPPSDGGGSRLTEIASRSQLRWRFARIMLVTVPLLVLLGTLSGQLAGSTENNIWYRLLEKPLFQPPGVVFGIVWTILYALMGVALAMVWDARGARGRGGALALFAVQLLLNLAWAPLFFRYHEIGASLALTGAIFVAALLTTIRFASIRRLAAWLMAPYLLWLIFAAALNLQIWQLNPEGGANVSDTGVAELQLPTVATWE